MYFNQFEYSLAKKTDDISKDFSKVITRIREIIYNQKFTGAAAGFLNPNIIARDLGLVDKAETALKADINSTVVVTDQKTADEVEKLKEKFKKE